MKIIVLIILFVSKLVSEYNSYFLSQINLIPTVNKEIEEKSKFIYENLTYEELEKKFNKILNSKLKNTGNIYIDACLQYDVDPVLAVSISLLETGCEWNCSLTKNNVGGNMKCINGTCTLLQFDTIEEGIYFFIKNIKDNYYDFGMKTPEEMNKKYASSKTWAEKVNNYIIKIKNI